MTDNDNMGVNLCETCIERDSDCFEGYRRAHCTCGEYRQKYSLDTSSWPKHGTATMLRLGERVAWG